MSQVLPSAIPLNCPHYGMVPKDFARNLDFRQQILEAAANDPVFAAQVVTMCAQDPLFYINVFDWTYDPRQSIRKLPMITYGFQDTAILRTLDSIVSGGDVTMPKSRTMGASTFLTQLIEWLWHFFELMSFLFMSRNQEYVDERGNPKSLFWKVDFLHQNQPRWLLPTGRWLGNKDTGRKTNHLENADNGSVIDGEATTGDAARGDRRTAILIDEFAAYSVTDGFAVLRATRDATYCRIFNSTYKGTGGAFYEVTHKTAARRIDMHWTSHPDYQRGMYRSVEDPDRKGEFTLELLDAWKGPVRVRRIEWGGEPKDLMFPDDYPFILDGQTRSPWFDNECARCASAVEIAQELNMDPAGSEYQFFDSKAIRYLIEKMARPAFDRGTLEFDPEDKCEPKKFTTGDKGPLFLWIELVGEERRPPSGRRYAVAGDVSAGTGASNSVLSVVDIDSGEKVAVWRDPNTRPKGFAQVAVAMAKWFNGALLIWDASGQTGKAFSQDVISLNYSNLYYRQNEEQVGGRISESPGYFMQGGSRLSLFEDYRDALATGAFINYSAMGLEECFQFIVKPGNEIVHSAAINSQDPTGAATAHGDEVVADALANKARIGKGTRNGKPVAPVAEIGSLQWRRNMNPNASARESLVELGAGW